MAAEWITYLFYGLIFSSPAYFANAIPVFVSGLGRVDWGKTFIDGKPFLGSHKTNGGVIAAVLAGGLAGIAAPLFFPEIFYNSGMKGYTYGIGFLLGFAAILGDAIGSFTKRRIKIKPGKPFPIVDQVGFVVAAFLLAAIFIDFPIQWPLYVIPFTLLAHLSANFIAYLMGWKEVWY